jgi:hypothetical protein
MTTSSGLKQPHLIETLESRIAPATFLTFTDVDGDLVKITSSKGILTGHATFADSGAGQKLLLLDLTDPSFAKTKLSFSVKRAAHGDGLVNVGKINAAGNDLERVFVPGDLGEIDAGDGNAVSPAIRAFTVYSMGAGVESAAGTPVTETQHTALADLLGAPLSGQGGVLSTVLSQLNLLQSVKTLSPEAGRVLATLGADVQALLATATDESGGPLKSAFLTTTAKHLLTNLAVDLGKVSALPVLDQALLGLLPTGLVSLQAKLEIVIGTPVAGLSLALGGLLPGLTLPGLTLPIVPVVNLLGDLLGQPLGTLPPVLVTTLHGLDTQLSNLLGTPELLSALPTDVQELLGHAGAQLTAVLGSTASLGPGLLRDLASLQANVASLASTAGAIPGFLTDAVATQLNALGSAIVTTVQSATGGQDAAHAITSDLMGGVSIFNIRGNLSNVFINVHGNLTSARIGGSITGGDATNGGELFVSGKLRALNVVGNLIGGTALNSGCVEVGGKTESILVRGSIVGGSGTHAGAVTLHGDALAITVRGDLSGHEGLFSGSITNANGFIKALEVRGSVIGADVDSSAAISATKEIKSLKINRGIWGDAAHGVAISAGGLLTQTGTQNFAFRDIRIGGTVQHTDVLAGYSADLKAVNGSAQIRSVFVGGDWGASSLSAGVADRGQAGFGDNSDQIFETHTAAIVSSIASIQIRGAVSGTSGGTDQFGFVAGSIGALTIGKAKTALHSNSQDSIGIAVTGDVLVREYMPSAPIV